MGMGWSRGRSEYPLMMEGSRVGELPAGGKADQAVVVFLSPPQCPTT